MFHAKQSAHGLVSGLYNSPACDSRARPICRLGEAPNGEQVRDLHGSGRYQGKKCGSDFSLNGDEALAARFVDGVITQ